MAAKKGMRGWGRVRPLPSKRHQASYIGPDGRLHNAPATFAAKIDAEGWLSAEQRKIELGVWRDPRETPKTVLTVRDYAERWQVESSSRLKPRTRDLYRGYLDRVVLPALGDTPLGELSVNSVRAWFAGLDAFPARNANAYSLLRTIMNQALDDELIAVNPCRIKRASVKHRVAEPVALSAREIQSLAESMTVDRWKALLLVAGFSGLRWGELAALSRSDFVLSADGNSVTVRRSVTRQAGKFVVGRPKSAAALRTVPLPSGLAPEIAAHLEEFALPGGSGLAFPSLTGDYPHENTVRPHLKRAALVIGYDSFRFHDLRHSAATLFAQAGATLADHMTLMGHTSPAMSARYTHSTAARNKDLVESIWPSE